MDTFSGQNNRAAIAALLILLGFAAIPAAAAKTQFDYDIFLVKDTLSVWLDVTPLLDQARMEDLSSGVDIYVAARLELVKPKLAIFSDKIFDCRGAILISRNISEDRYELKLATPTYRKRVFDSRSAMAAYLADSIVFAVGRVDSLNTGETVQLKLGLSCKSQSANILGEDKGAFEDNPDSSAGETAVLEDLFSLFMKITGLGRADYKITSPEFTLQELPEQPR